VVASEREVCSPGTSLDGTPFGTFRTPLKTNSLPIEQNDDFLGGQAENLYNFHNIQEPLQFRVDAGIEGYSITVA